MLIGFADGGLELRQEGDGSARLQGRFPYNSRAVLSDGGRSGRPKKELFAPGAFRHSVESDQEVHLLVGHSFDRPLASRSAGSLTLEDTPEALVFSAEIAAAMMDVSHVRDALAAMQAGLIAGISPGFRMPPSRTVPNAESVELEDPSEGLALIRTIREAILFELSLVTRPAYPQTQVEQRSWKLTEDALSTHAGLHRTLRRWRV